MKTNPYACFPTSAGLSHAGSAATDLSTVGKLDFKCILIIPAYMATSACIAWLSYRSNNEMFFEVAYLKIALCVDASLCDDVIIVMSRGLRLSNYANIAAIASHYDQE